MARRETVSGGTVVLAALILVLGGIGYVQADGRPRAEWVIGFVLALVAFVGSVVVYWRRRPSSN